MSTPQNFGLDLVRAGAIAAVLFSHSAEWWIGTGPQVAFQASYVGRAGVEAFFSLSGFLIGGILIRLVDGGFGLRTLGRFWTRRWMRTLPAYWVLILALNWHFGTQDWRSLVFLQNFVPRAGWTPLTPHTWSLALEEWFYLVVPALLLLATVLLRHKRSWALPLVCVGLVVVCSAGRFAAGVQPSALWGPEPGVNPILRLDCAAWGLMAAWLVRHRPVPHGAAVMLVTVGTVLLVLLGFVSVRLFEPARLVGWGVSVWGPAWSPLHPSLEEFAAACLVLGLHRLLPRAAGPLAWGVGTVSRLSYSLYLVHLPVLYLARGQGLDDAAGWGPRFAIMALVAAAALTLRYGVELPVLALRDRWVTERPMRGSRLQGSNASTPSANSAVNAGAPGGV